MKKELKINVERFGGTGVVVEVVDMDDSERGEGVLIENEDNLVIKSIQSLSFPELRGNELFVWGGDRYEDDRIFGHRFESEEMRERAIDDINSLVEEYNKQKIKKEFAFSKEYERQVKMNELLMDMARWQYKYDEPIDMTEIGTCYYISILLVKHSITLEVRSFYGTRPIGLVFFSNEEKAEECAKVFKDRIFEVYGINNKEK